jgi:hypothetical protein
MERELYPVVLGVWFALAPIVFVRLWLVPAPYGRFAGGARGPSLPARWGWLAMESPALAGMVALFATGRHRESAVAAVFLAIWLAHYLRRGLFYPLRLPDATRPMPLLVVAAGFLFQLVNVYLNGRWLFELGPAYPESWLVDPRFVAGAALFAAGTIVNVRADAELRRLRSAGRGYRTPEGGLFRRISAPHYLGEIGIWCGWALLTGCLPALAVAAWTIANLAPRARSHDRHGRATIAGYPAGRKVLVPGIW